jgi:hypothetical protein
MKVIDPGHVYEVDAVDGGSPQRIVFVKREGANYPGNVGSHPGTQMQELLRVLLHRARYVNAQIQSDDTDIAIRCMQEALGAMEVRHARKHNRRLMAGSFDEIENAPTCKTCGHIECQEHK